MSTSYEYSDVFYSTSFYNIHNSCGIQVAKSTSIIRSSIQKTFDTTYTTDRTITEISSIQLKPSPVCQFGIHECNDVWLDYAASSASWSAAPLETIWNISLASPPSVLVLNGVTTTLTEGEITSPPVLTIGTQTYPPQSVWPRRDDFGNYWARIFGFEGDTDFGIANLDGGLESKHSQSTFYGLDTFIGTDYGLTRVFLEPGNSFVWSKTRPRPRRPSCTPQIMTTAEQVKCRIEPWEVSLLYFPVPTTVTRDMCATAPVEGPVTDMPTVPYVGKSSHLVYPAMKQHTPEHGSLGGNHC